MVWVIAFGELFFGDLWCVVWGYGGMRTHFSLLNPLARHVHRSDAVGLDREALPGGFEHRGDGGGGHHHDGDPVMAGGTRIVHVVQAHLCARGIGAAQLGHDLPRRAEGPGVRGLRAVRRVHGDGLVVGAAKTLHGAVDLRGDLGGVPSDVHDVALGSIHARRDTSRVGFGGGALLECPGGVVNQIPQGLGNGRETAGGHAIQEGLDVLPWGVIALRPD